MTFQQEFHRFQSSHRLEGLKSFHVRYPRLSELCSDRGLFVHGLRDGGAFIFALDRSVEVELSEGDLTDEEQALELEAHLALTTVH